MTKRTLRYLSMVCLFALMQIGMPALALSHWVDCHQAQHKEQGAPEHHCEQCLSLSHTANANLTPVFDIAILVFGYLFVAALRPAIITARFFSCSVRAPPRYLQA